MILQEQHSYPQIIECLLLSRCHLYKSTLYQYINLGEVYKLNIFWQLPVQRLTMKKKQTDDRDGKEIMGHLIISKMNKW